MARFCFDEQLSLLLFFAALAIALAWLVAQPPGRVRVKVRHGLSARARGKVTDAFLAAVTEVCREFDVNAAEVRGVARGERTHSPLHRAEAASRRQRLRNWRAISGCRPTASPGDQNSPLKAFLARRVTSEATITPMLFLSLAFVTQSADEIRFPLRRQDVRRLGGRHREDLEDRGRCHRRRLARQDRAAQRVPLHHGKTYGNFELKVTFKLVGDKAKANAGVQFRTKRIPNHHEVSGYQADVGQDYWGALTTSRAATRCSPARRRR